MKYKLSNLQKKVVENAEEKYEQSQIDTGDDILNRIKSMVDNEKIVKNPKFELSKEEEFAIFDSVVKIVESGESAQQIAKYILMTLKDKLNDIKDEATNAKGPKGAVFRRSEQ